MNCEWIASSAKPWAYIGMAISVVERLRERCCRWGTSHSSGRQAPTDLPEGRGGTAVAEIL